MRWVHTYSGLIVGWLLFAIFVTGTSSYYKKEITLWMQPELHKSIQSKKTLDVAMDKAIEFSNKSDTVSIYLPDTRSNAIRVMARNENSSSKKAQSGDSHGHSHDHSHDHGEGAKNKEKSLEKNQKENLQKKEKSNKKKRRMRTPPKYFDATTGEQIKPRATAGGNFLYRFHFELYNMPRGLARWIVGIATMFMFVAIITGVIIHRRIFKDIFTFRPKAGPRGWMDAHILPAVAALPFFIMITYSGLLFFNSTMMPWAIKAYYGDDRIAYKQAFMKATSAEKPSTIIQNKVEVVDEKAKNTNIERIINNNTNRYINKYDNSKNAHRILNSNANKQIAIIKKKTQEESLDLTKEQILAVLKKANGIWPNNVGNFKIKKDEAKKTLQMEVYPKEETTIFSFKWNKEYALYDAKNARLIKKEVPPLNGNLVINTSTAFMSLHMALFADSTLRFIFFICGIMGIILIGTGLILWTKKREYKNEQKKSIGFFIVEKLNIGTIVGIFIAIAVYFIANRLIPMDEVLRKSFEINAFFIAWALAYIYAFIRNSAKAWIEQLVFAAILFMLLPILNAITTFESFSQIYNRDMILIYFDIFFVSIASALLLCAYIANKKSKKGEIK